MPIIVMENVLYKSQSSIIHKTVIHLHLITLMHDLQSVKEGPDQQVLVNLFLGSAVISSCRTADLPPSCPDKRADAHDSKSLHKPNMMGLMMRYIHIYIKERESCLK